MIRIARNSTTEIDLISDWNNKPNPWQQLFEPTKFILEKLGFKSAGEINNLRVFEGPKQTLIEVHPLWQDDHPKYMDTKQKAKTHGNKPVRRINPFMTIRRASNYLSALSV